jgi:hypothetical protein
MKGHTTASARRVPSECESHPIPVGFAWAGQQWIRAVFLRALGHVAVNSLFLCFPPIS